MRVLNNFSGFYHINGMSKCSEQTEYASFFPVLHFWSSGIFSKPTGISNIPYPYPHPYMSVGNNRTSL